MEAQKQYSSDDKKQLFKEWLEIKDLKKRTVDEYIRYLDHYRQRHSLFNQRAVNKFLSENKNIVARSFIKNFKDFLIDYKKEFSFDTGIIEDIVEIRIPKVSGRKEQKVIVTINEEEMELVKNKLKNKRDRLMLYLSFYCGLRLQELLHIKPFDFRWKEFDENPKEYGEVIVFGKGHKEALAFVPRDVMELIRDYINQDLKGKITPETPVFKISARYWQKALKKASEEALNKPIHPHTLRHSAGTYLAKRDVPLMVIKEYMRHSSVSSTEIYLHMDKSDVKAKVANAFN